MERTLCFSRSSLETGADMRTRFSEDVEEKWALRDFRREEDTEVEYFISGRGLETGVRLWNGGIVFGEFEGFSCG
jgi:hypothetical protein